MKFDFDGQRYLLEFQRDKKTIRTVRHGNVKTVQSKYPYTTARLITISKTSVLETRNPIAEASVGCTPTDSYSNEKGRLYALRALSAVLRRAKMDVGLTAALWQAYMNRKEQKQDVIEGNVVEQKAEQKQPLQLPASTETVH